MKTIRIEEVAINRLVEMSNPSSDPASQFLEYDAHEWSAHQGLIPAADLGGSGTRITTYGTWVVHSNGCTVLVDTGVGNAKPRPAVPSMDNLESSYLENLEALGVTPESVDFVVCTHLHIDHVGWNTRLEGGRWVPTFPNATYLFAFQEVRFWDGEPEPGTIRQGDVFQANVFDDSVAPVIAAGQVVEWEDHYDLDPQLRLEAAPGHTPGNAIVKVRSGASAGVFIGDLMHSPVQTALTHWNDRFSEDAPANVASRRRTLEWAAREDALLFACHFGGDNAFKVRPDAGTFTISSWVPLVEDGR